ncbi:MAG: hypothetical protein ACJ8CR_01695 [Roseiflexaceae bacterium]
MSTREISTSVVASQVQFVVGAEGKPTAVLLDIATWERVLQALEDAEDLVIAKQALAELAATGGDPEKAGYLAWGQARAELEAENAQE